MKILHVIWRPRIGGAELFGVELARRQAKENNVSIYYLGAGDDKLPCISGVSVVAGGMRSGFDFSGLLRFRRYAVSGGFDVIHHHQNLPAVAITAFVPGSITVKHEHGTTAAGWKTFRERILSRVVSGLIDVYIANSVHTQSQLIQYEGIPANRIRVIPCGIDIDKFQVSIPVTDARRALSLDTGCKVIGFVGRLSQEKGADLFVKVASELHRLDPGYRFIVAGDGPLRKEIEAMAMCEGLGEAIQFLGFREEVVAILKACDMILVTSRNEAQGIIAIEAMAAGIPVAATNVGGLSDVVSRVGMLMDSNNAEFIGGAIHKTMQDNARIHEMIVRGGARAKDFDITIIGARVYNLYRELQSR